MNRKSKPRKKPKAPTSAELMAKDIREIRREIKRLDDPVRYVVYVRPFRGVNTRFFLDVSEDTFRLSAWTAGGDAVQTGAHRSPGRQSLFRPATTPASRGAGDDQRVRQARQRSQAVIIAGDLITLRRFRWSFFPVSAPACKDLYRRCWSSGKKPFLLVCGHLFCRP